MKDEIKLLLDYPRIKIVDEHEPREYSAISCSNGIVLCDKEDGAFLVCRFPEDIERLKALLDQIEIKKVESK